MSGECRASIAELRELARVLRGIGKPILAARIDRGIAIISAQDDRIEELTRGQTQADRRDNGVVAQRNSRVPDAQRPDRRSQPAPKSRPAPEGAQP